MLSHVPFFVLAGFTDRPFLDNDPILATRLFIMDDKPMHAADTRCTHGGHLRTTLVSSPS